MQLLLSESKFICLESSIVHIRGSSIQTGIFQGKYMHCPFIARDAQEFRVSAECYAKRNIKKLKNISCTVTMSIMIVI